MGLIRNHIQIVQASVALGAADVVTSIARTTHDLRSIASSPKRAATAALASLVLVSSGVMFGGFGNSHAEGAAVPQAEPQVQPPAPIVTAPVRRVCTAPAESPQYIEVSDTLLGTGVYDLHGRRVATYSAARNYLYLKSAPTAEAEGITIGRYAVNTGMWAPLDAGDINGVFRASNDASYGERIDYQHPQAARIDAILTVLGANCRVAGTPHPLRRPANNVQQASYTPRTE